MIYNALGKTGLRVSKLSFGAAALGEEYGRIDAIEGKRAVHRALELGINFFDVAPFYGRTLAETRLGEALAGHRQEAVLATKVGRHDEDPATGFDFSAAGIRKSLEGSLRRLGTDYVDLLQAHDIEFAPFAQIVGETIPAMRRLQAAGKARFIGITAYPLGMLARVAAATDIDTVLSYSRYNLLDTSMDEVLTPVAERLGLGLINASALDMGLLTAAPPPDWHPAPRRVFAVARTIAQLCRERGATLPRLALQFALDHPAVSTTLVGMSTVAEVEQNVGIIGERPDAAILAEVREAIRPVANICWQEGLPQNWDAGAVPQFS